MAQRQVSWRGIAATGTISLLAACAQTPAAKLASDAQPIPPGAKTTWYHIEFTNNSHLLDDQSRLTVADVSNILQNDPQSVATIIGRTDTVGSTNDNMHLSHIRADTVRDALVYQRNVAADRVETRWTSETQQRVASANNTAMEQNRVIDIAIH